MGNIAELTIYSNVIDQMFIKITILYCITTAALNYQ